jgi:hypothetical protein
MSLVTRSKQRYQQFENTTFLCEARTQRSGIGNGDSGKLERDLPHAAASLAAPTEQPELRRYRQLKYAGRLSEMALKVCVSRRKD